MSKDFDTESLLNAHHSRVAALPDRGIYSDGAALLSTSHPRAVWWRRLWNWLAHRDVRAASLETIEIERPD